MPTVYIEIIAPKHVKNMEEIALQAEVLFSHVWDFCEARKDCLFGCSHDIGDE